MENLEPMIRNTDTSILTEFISVAITTTYDPILGWTTQIHGGMFDKKMYVAKTFSRAEYHHELAVRMVMKDPNRNSLGPCDCRGMDEKPGCDHTG